MRLIYNKVSDFDCDIVAVDNQPDVSISSLSAMNSNNHPTHTRHLDNLDGEDLPRYRRAIYESGCDLSLLPGAYDCNHRMWDASRYSLWCPLLVGDLSRFWKLMRAQ